MDIRLILAIGISLVILVAAWFVMSARRSKARISAEREHERVEIDRLASERLNRLATSRREQELEDREDDLADEAEIRPSEPVPEEAQFADAAIPPDVSEAEELPAPDAHADDPEKTREANSATAILRPVVPIDRKAPRASWLGGRPHLPAATEWPEADGKRLAFFAGISLAELPSQVWAGLGPREGWLLVFLNAETHDPLCLHVPGLGTGQDERPEAFAQGYEFFGPQGGLGQDPVRGSRIPRCFAEWPVVIDLQEHTASVATRAPKDLSSGRRRREIFDFADPALLPVDEFAAIALLDVINDDFAQLRTSRYQDIDAQLENGRANVERLRGELTGVLQGESPDQDLAAQLRQQLAQAELLHRTLVSEYETNSAAAAHLGQLAGLVRNHALRSGLKRKEIMEVMQGLSEVPVAWRERSGKPGEEEVTVITRPITQVTEGDPHPGASMIAVASEHAKQAYTRRPEVLSSEQNEFWAQQLALQTHPLGTIGGAPSGHVQEFDAENEVLLLELESSALVGWMFGDTDRLVLTIASEDLAAGAFDRVKLQVSNC